MPATPAQQHAVDLPQGRMHYRVAGPADSPHPPVLFVHGILVNHTLWTKAADRLAELGIRSYAPDLPLGGHPEALRDDADLTPRGVARLLLDFAAALDLRDLTLVGNDTGGALCQFVLDTDAERIGRLVLTNCDAFDKFPPAPFGLLTALARRPGRIRLLLPPMRSARLRNGALGFGPLVRTPLDADVTWGWAAPLEQPAIRRDTARFMRGIDKRDLLDVSTRLASFDKPVLLVWGDADRFFKISLAQRLADTFPQARLSPVEGGRTFIPWDEPERLAQEISGLVAAPA